MKKIIIIDGGPRKNFKEAKRQYREEHWEEDLQKVFDAGRQMAEKILE